MKLCRKIHKQIFHFAIALILIIGLCFPAVETLAQEEAEDDGHSGGFLVKSEKIEGVMDAFEIMQGNVDIPEGQIFGLTIIKTLSETEYGTLVIKIKSPGPVPLNHLKAKSIGYPFFASLCDSSKEEWLCMEGVEMTLSEQSVNSIDLPNATVETCYEGQCSDDKEEELETLSLMHAEEKSIDDIEQDLQSANEILHVVEEELANAQQTNQLIAEEDQEQQVQRSLDQFHQSLTEEEELLKQANDVHQHYSAFNENASLFHLRTSVIDDILKHVTHILEHNGKAIEELEASIQEAAEEISAQKQNLQTQESLAEYEALEETLSDVKAMMDAIEEKVENHQKALEPLAQSSTAMMETLTQYYEAIQDEIAQIDKLEKRGDIDALLQALDVAEPAKELEKQIRKLLDEMTETNLLADTEKHEEMIAAANEQAAQSIVTIALAKQVGELGSQIDEEIDEEAETWEKQFEQLNQLEKEFGFLVQLAQLPETLVLEHELSVRLNENEKDDYRVQMLTNISEWKQWLHALNEKQEEIETALKQYENNQSLLAQLAQSILAAQERYTPAELSTLARLLNLESIFEQEQQLSELIEDGLQVKQALDPMVDSANNRLDQLEAVSTELVEKVIVVNTLNDESFSEFVNLVAEFRSFVDQIEQPAKQLQNHLLIAEDLLGERITEYTELQDMQQTIARVEKMAERLNQLIEALDALPYFDKIKEQVKELQEAQNVLESLIQ